MALVSSSFRMGRATVASLRMGSSMDPVCSSLRTAPGGCASEGDSVRFCLQMTRCCVVLVSGTKGNFHMGSFRAAESSAGTTG